MHLRPNGHAIGALYEIVSRFDNYFWVWMGRGRLEDDQVLFQYRDFNDRVYYIAVLILGTKLRLD